MELGIAVQQVNGSLRPKNKMSFGSNSIEHVVCTQCGFIVESYVTKPEKFIETM